MSRDGAIVLPFFNGEEYRFRLAWGQLIKLQEERLCGPRIIFDRLYGEDWVMEDIRDVIKIGLVGGGLDEVKARKLVREYVEDRAPMEGENLYLVGRDEKKLTPLNLARDIIAAGLLGPPDAEPLEKKTVATPNGLTTSTMDESASPNSSAAAS